MDRVGAFDPNAGEATYGAAAMAALQNADPSAGKEGSIPPFEMCAHPIEELVHAIEQSGQVPDHADLTQLWQAIVWAVGSVWITADVTYTVDPAGGADFLTIQAALDSLKTKLIAKGATVTISLVAGAHAGFDFDGHPTGERIQIVGQGLTGAWPGRTGFVGTKATDLTFLEGRFPTRIEAAGDAVVITGRLGLIKNVLLVGDGTGSGLGVGAELGAALRPPSSVSVENVWAHDFGECVLSAGGQITGTGLGASYSAGHGIRAVDMGRIDIASTSPMRAVYNTACGVFAEGESAIRAPSLESWYNSDNGVRAYRHSLIFAPSLQVQQNATNIASQGRSYIQMEGGNALNAAAGVNLSAIAGAFVYAVDAYGGASTSPAVNTAGNDHAYIKYTAGP